MKLPWDEKYLKISFHVILTLIVVYILAVLVSGAAYAFLNMSAVLRGVGGVLRRILSVFAPLFVGLAAAYLLEPAVEFFQRRYETVFAGKLMGVRTAQGRRTAGVILTFVSIALVIGVVCLSVAVKLKPQAGQSVGESVAIAAAKAVNDLSDFYTRMQIRLKEMGMLEYTSRYLERVNTAVLGLVQNLGETAVRSAAAAGGGVVSFLLGLVLAVYFLRDKAALLRKLDEVTDVFLPHKLNHRLKNVLSDIDAIFSGYIRGQLIDALIMTVLIGGWLALLKVNFAMMIGVFSGLANLIPYFGSIIAFVLAVAVAFFSGEPTTALYAAIGIIVLQQIDALVIVPKVVGESVELSPILVLLSLAVAGELFGLTGMLFAVPVTAVLKLFFSRVMNRRKERRAA